MDRYIEFKEVGRGKYSGKRLLHPEISTPDEIAYAAYQEARRHVASHEVDASYDPESNVGLIFVGGFRCVGKFSVVNV